MALVVFLRGVNVGGHKVFRPREFAGSLRGLDVTSIGAAGTFVVRGKIAAKTLRQQIARALPHQTEVMICAADEILKLVNGQPFGKTAPGKDEKWFVTIFEKSPREAPHLPFEFPAAQDWCVRFVQVTEKFALSVWRRRGTRLVYPNEVFEKTFGVPATTRGWPTILSIVEALQNGE
jgi:uncharacterized protein (DUF1697 family)